MNTIELRLFILGLQGINPHLSPNDKLYDTEFKEVFIPTAKLVELFGGNTWYLHGLDKVCDKLFDAKIKLRFEDGGWELYHLFRKMKYVPAEGLYIHFEDLLRPYLLDLYNARGYTQIDVEQIFHLTSPYAVRLIELMLRYQNIPDMKKRKLIERTMTLEEVRFTLNVPDGAYAGRLDNLRKRIIEAPIQEINEKTSYKMSYEVLKHGGTGGRVYAFKFFLDTSAIPREKPAVYVGDVIEKLKLLGFNEQSARAIRAKCESDADCLKRIANATRSLSMKKKRGTVENELGYLRKYIEENWQSAAAKAKAQPKRSEQYPPPFKEVMAKTAKPSVARLITEKPTARTSGEPQHIKDILRNIIPEIKKPAPPKPEEKSPLILRPLKTRLPKPEEFRDGEQSLASPIVDTIARAIIMNEVTESVVLLLQMRGLTAERFKTLYME